MHARLLGLLALAVTLFASRAEAQMYRHGPPPKHRLIYTDLTAFRANPLGLTSDARFMYRLRLFESDSMALADNCIAIGLAPIVTPADARIGVQVEFQPLTILKFWALYEAVGYFGTFDLFQSFSSAASTYDDTTRSRLGALPDGDPGRHYRTSGTQLEVGANFMVKVSDFVVRTQAKLARPDFKLRAGDRVFYESTFDVLVQNGAWVFTNDTDFLWTTDGPLTLGARWTQTKPFYDDRAFAPDDDRALATQMTHRVGPLAAYTWKRPDGAPFEQSVITVLNWYVRHPFRTGQDVTRLAPYFVLAYAITGDLTGAFSN